MQMYGKLAIGAAFVMVLTMASNAFAIPSGPKQNYGEGNHSVSGANYNSSSNSGHPPKDERNTFKENHVYYPIVVDNQGKKNPGRSDNNNEESEENEVEDKKYPYGHEGHYKNVPEPTSVLLLGAGLAGLGIWRRKVS